MDEKELRFDELGHSSFKYPEDFDGKKFKSFLTKSGLPQNISTKELLQNISLGKIHQEKFTLTNAGILLFGRDSHYFFRNNFITCVLYKGRERMHIIDRKDFTDDIVTNSEQALAFLKQHLRLRYQIEGSGPRKEIFELPEEALREVVLNAIVHRDYFEERYGVFIEIFDNRVEISNFGKLLFDKKKLGTLSLPRNPLLFDIFYRMNLIEKVGSGIQRIKNLMKERKLKVSFRVDDFFKVIFYRELPGKTFLPTLNERQRRAWDYLQKHFQITHREYRLLHPGISEKTVLRDLQNLITLKLIRSVGEKKGRRYELVS